MPIPTRKQTPTKVEGLFWIETDDGSQTLWDANLDETYHSGCGAIAESLHVYLHNSGVAERLAAGLPTAVFEVGFGTGMNFWLTAAIAEQRGAGSLTYAAVEKWLLPNEVFRELVLPPGESPPTSDGQQTEHDQGHRSLLERSQALLATWCNQRERVEQMPSGLTSSPRSWRLGENIVLHLRVGCLEQMALEHGLSSYDAVYFDAFSPQTSPELWTVEVFQAMYGLLKPGGRLVTYCVKRSVQDGLRQVGFNVSKTPGPSGGKREVLVAVKPLS